VLKLNGLRVVDSVSLVEVREEDAAEMQMEVIGHNVHRAIHRT